MALARIRSAMSVIMYNLFLAYLYHIHKSPRARVGDSLPLENPPTKILYMGGLFCYLFSVWEHNKAMSLFSACPHPLRKFLQEPMAPYHLVSHRRAYCNCEFTILVIWSVLSLLLCMAAWRMRTQPWPFISLYSCSFVVPVELWEEFLTHTLQIKSLSLSWDSMFLYVNNLLTSARGITLEFVQFACSCYCDYWKGGDVGEWENMRGREGEWIMGGYESRKLRGRRGVWQWNSERWWVG